jgi:hypothetical protein
VQLPLAPPIITGFTSPDPRGPENKASPPELYIVNNGVPEPIIILVAWKLPPGVVDVPFAGNAALAVAWAAVSAVIALAVSPEKIVRSSVIDVITLAFVRTIATGISVTPKFVVFTAGTHDAEVLR